MEDRKRLCITCKNDTHFLRKLLMKKGQYTERLWQKVGVKRDTNKSKERKTGQDSFEKNKRIKEKGKWKGKVKRSV